ncbi:MAG: NAD-dependent epimerase/dehydratase family protein [Phycisphaerales bacterium]|nr:NAD-dependent epimerase/dehydratase family protein [Phycisphaerales bacterium]
MASNQILVTGSAGFVGSTVAERLAARGDRVLGLDCFDPYYSVAWKRRTAAAQRAQFGIETLETDVRDRDALRRLFESRRFDAVVHLAALAGIRASVARPERYVEVDLNGTQNVLDAARAGGCDHVVFASTSSVYGDAARAPFVEDDASDRPLQPYAAAKRGAEILGYAYHRLYGLRFTALRLFSVYGPRNRPDMMAYRIAESIERGTEIEVFDGGQGLWRDWTFVDDVADGFVRAVDVPLGYEIINLGRGEPIELRAFIEGLETVAGGRARVRSVPKPACDMQHTHADITKARVLLGYQPRTGIREGSAALWRWYRDHTLEGAASLAPARPTLSAA